MQFALHGATIDNQREPRIGFPLVAELLRSDLATAHGWALGDGKSREPHDGKKVMMDEVALVSRRDRSLLYSPSFL